MKPLLAVFLLFPCLVLAQTTNALLTLSIDCNSSNLVTFLPMPVGYTNRSVFFNTLVYRTQFPDLIELKGITYGGINVTNIKVPLYTNLYFVPLSFSNTVFYPSQWLTLNTLTNSSGGGGGSGCNYEVFEIIYSSDPMSPPQVIIHCLDGVPCFDFSSG